MVTVATMSSTVRKPIVVHPIGRVESSLKDPAEAPKQGDEGTPEAWLVFDPDVAAGLRDLRPAPRFWCWRGWMERWVGCLTLARQGGTAGYTSD